MTAQEYLEECLLLLSTSPIVEHFHIVKRREIESQGFLKARAILTDESLLEIALYCTLVGDIVCPAAYRYHWQDKHGNLLKRWDDAKHHPELGSFPHHVHLRNDEEARESASMDLWGVLRELESEIAKGMMHPPVG